MSMFNLRVSNKQMSLFVQCNEKGEITKIDSNVRQFMGRTLEEILSWMSWRKIE